MMMIRMCVCLDGCSDEDEQLVVENNPRGSISWTEGNIGATIMSRCPCRLVPVPRFASRLCLGNFVGGGQWAASNKSACQFDELSFELCDARVSVSAGSRRRLLPCIDFWAELDLTFNCYFETL